MRFRVRAVSVAAALVTVLLAMAPPAARAAGSYPVVAVFSWDGTRECAHPRPDSVICISGEADVAGLGRVEYARDAVGNGKQTKDGCPELSTVGTIWVSGGTAVLTGRPASTCGAKDNPDAHYLYTISAGTGTLAGASGSGDIVADHGVDRWHGTLVAPHFVLVAQPSKTSTMEASVPPTASPTTSPTASRTTTAPAATPSQVTVTSSAEEGSSSGDGSLLLWILVPFAIAVAATSVAVWVAHRRGRR